MMPSEDVIREEFKLWRRTKGYSQRFVQKLLWDKFAFVITDATICQWENAIHGLSYERVRFICELMESEPIDLLGETPEND